jgi:hypothetical protein
MTDTTTKIKKGRKSKKDNNDDNEPMNIFDRPYTDESTRFMVHVNERKKRTPKNSTK